MEPSTIFAGISILAFAFGMSVVTIFAVNDIFFGLSSSVFATKRLKRRFTVSIVIAIVCLVLSFLTN